jgi:hypothetical protein
MRSNWIKGGIKLPPEASYFGDADGVVGLVHALVEGGELFVVFLEVLCWPRTRISAEKMPCLRAFILEALRPYTVLGPVDFRELAWLAVILAAEVVFPVLASAMLFSIGGNLSSGCEEENGTVPF